MYARSISELSKGYPRNYHKPCALTTRLYGVSELWKVWYMPVNWTNVFAKIFICWTKITEIIGPSLKIPVRVTDQQDYH